MANESKGKIDRVLGIYTKLMDGDLIHKAQEASYYNVNERSIERDIEDIRKFLENSSAGVGYINSVIYDRKRNGYCLEQIYKMKLSNSEVLALCKILLDSRAFTKGEMTDMLDRLISCCVPEKNQREIRDLIKNEEFHYVELQYKTVFINTMWEIGQAIRENCYIEMAYMRTKDKKTVKRKVQPVAILFSEYYFYMTALIEDDEVKKDFDVINDSFPTIYRIDRIKEL